MSKRKNVGVILAGGNGNRFGTSLPKQFMKIAGKMVIEHTVDTFQRNDMIDEIVLVVHENHIHLAEQTLIRNKWTKVKKVLRGGKERYSSTLAAVNAYIDRDVNLILHDSVRPMVSERIIDDVALALLEFEAVDTAIKASDTIIMAKNGIISKIPRRDECRQGQTPQAFRVSTLKKAYEIALKDPDFITTDDCGVVLKYLPEIPIKVVEGDVQNIKLTYMEDLYLLDKLFQLKTQSASQEVELAKLRGKVLICFGGSQGIGKAICDLAEENGAIVYSFSRKTTNSDITDYENVKSSIEKVYNNTGNIDFIILTAGLLEIAPLHTADSSDIDRMINVNFRGAAYVSQCAYTYLKASKGALLHFTSSSYTLGRPLYGLYSASKAAVVNLTQSLAQEWHGAEIRVNCINPERTKTGMRISNFGEEPEETLLDPKTVAIASIGVLLSERSGQVIDVRKDCGNDG